MFYFIFHLMTCVSQLTITRPSLKNLEWSACSANRIRLIWDPTTLKNLLKCIKNSIQWLVLLSVIYKYFCNTVQLLEALIPLKDFLFKLNKIFLLQYMYILSWVKSYCTWCKTRGRGLSYALIFAWACCFQSLILFLSFFETSCWDPIW
jgi:hypothetical protein